MLLKKLDQNILNKFRIPHVCSVLINYSQRKEHKKTTKTKNSNFELQMALTAHVSYIEKSYLNIPTIYKTL